MPVEKASELITSLGCSTLLEIGCGGGGIIAQFDVPCRVGVDHWKPYIEQARKDYPGIAFMKQDVRAMGVNFLPGSFDAVIGFDVLEHIPDDYMERVVLLCERIATKIVIFFFPLDEAGYERWQEELDGNPSMKHVQIMREQTFIDWGYNTIRYPDYAEPGITALLAYKEI
jgi:SAM-dependent methyltransferase